MATYTVETVGAARLASRPHTQDFKYRQRSRDGHPTAQPEFDLRRRAGEHVVLTKWENFVAKVMARANHDRG